MIAILDRHDAAEIEAEAEIEVEMDPSPAPARARSGGPRTPEGKNNSRRNALKHGLRARVLLPDDLAAAVAGRAAELTDELGPRSPYEEFLVGEMALASARIERCAGLSVVDLGRCIERAALCWEGDRRNAVEDLGARLPKDPARVAQALRRSRQGADWLIERWEGLAEALQSNGEWDDAQRRLAFDLLGVAPDLRNGSKRVPPATDPAALAALAAWQVARLREDREAVLDDLDEAERGMAELGMALEEDAATARLRKYEASCRRALLWARAELRRVREESAPAAEPHRPAAPPAPEARPAPAMAPPPPSVPVGGPPAPARPLVALPAAVPPPAPPAVEAQAPRNRRERRARQLQARRIAPGSAR